jgi:hypothetical protein
VIFLQIRRNHLGRNRICCRILQHIHLLHSLRTDPKVSFLLQYHNLLFQREQKKDPQRIAIICKTHLQSGPIPQNPNLLQHPDLHGFEASQPNLKSHVSTQFPAPQCSSVVPQKPNLLQQPVAQGLVLLQPSEMTVPTRVQMIRKRQRCRLLRSLPSDEVMIGTFMNARGRIGCKKLKVCKTQRTSELIFPRHTLDLLKVASCLRSAIIRP